MRDVVNADLTGAERNRPSNVRRTFQGDAPREVD
jgi:hypothetical protein